MKTAIPWMLLAASAFFNAFFIAGMFAPPHPRGMPRDGPERRVEMISRELGLTGEQKEDLLEIEKKFNEVRMSRERLEAQALDKVILELAVDNPDEAIIGKFLDIDSSDSPRHHLVSHLRTVMKILDAGQREKAAHLFRRGFCKGAGPGFGCGPGPGFGPGPGPGGERRHGQDCEGCGGKGENKQDGSSPPDRRD